jgi:hypothetical protein
MNVVLYLTVFTTFIYSKIKIGDFVGINNKQAEREGEKLTTPIGMRSIFEIHIIPGSTAHH